MFNAAQGLNLPKVWMPIAVALAVVTVLLVAPSATGQAPAREWNYVKLDRWNIGRDLCAVGDDGGYGYFAVACFEPEGDHLNVADARGDGRRVAMRWWIGKRKAPKRHGMCVNTKGFSGGGAWGPWDLMFVGRYGCNKNLPEKAVIKFQVGKCYAARRDCSKMKNWTAWSAIVKWRVNG